MNYNTFCGQRVIRRVPTLRMILLAVTLDHVYQRHPLDCTVSRVSVDISADMLTDYLPTRSRESADMSVNTSAEIRMTFANVSIDILTGNSSVIY